MSQLVIKCTILKGLLRVYWGLYILCLHVILVVLFCRCYILNCVNDVFVIKPFFSTCFTGWHSHRDLWDSELANRASRYPINCDVERSLQLQYS